MARLQRTLSLGSVVLFGIAYMTPIIVLGTFGILAEISRGAVPAAYVAASLAMLFTALSYARMAALFPVAGSAYSYVRRSINDHLGFIAGWSVMLDYLFLGKDKRFEFEVFRRVVVVIAEEISRRAANDHEDRELLGRYPEEYRGNRHSRPDLCLL